MNVAFCAGGTLGHIYPALSLIEIYKTKYPQDKLFLIVSKRDKQYIENLKLDKVNDIKYIYAIGLNKNILKSLFINIKAYNEIKKYFKDNNIKLVFGFGGFISGISIKVAKYLHIYNVIHEQNSTIGLANKWCLKYTNAFLTTFEMREYHRNQHNIGNPRYFKAKELLDNHYKSKYNLLITSGTNGSKVINDIAVEFLNSPYSKNFLTTLVTGKKYFHEVKAKLQEGTHYEVLPYTDKMIQLMNKSGIAITRSGSSTIWELAALNCLGIYIPSPNVTNNHQLKNAKEMEKMHLGIIIKEEDLNLNNLISALKIIILNYDKYKSKMLEYENNINIESIIEIIHKESGEING